MARPAVFITDSVDDAAIRQIETIADVTVDHKISGEDLIAVIGNYDGLVVRSRTKVNRAVIAAASKLRVIGRAGVGVDNIDVAAATEKGIVVVNSPLAATIAVAELTLGMMLALARDLPQANASMKRGEWDKKRFKGTELFGKTLGLVGMGRIGSAVAGRASALGMHVISFDPYVNPNQTAPEHLHQVLAQSDYVSVHTPLTAETQGLINAAAFAAMKPGAYIVCTARGGVIDEAALVAALNSGKVAGAALDVFETEPPGATELVLHPKVIATPHVGANTDEAQLRAGEDIAQEIIAALTGKPTHFRVN